MFGLVYKNFSFRRSVRLHDFLNYIIYKVFIFFQMITINCFSFNIFKIKNTFFERFINIPVVSKVRSCTLKINNEQI